MAYQGILNTHYNLLDCLLLANPGLVRYVGSMVHPTEDLSCSAHAQQLFTKWWNEHQEDFRSIDRTAIYTVWEVVYWAKTESDANGTWWDQRMKAHATRTMA